MEMETKPHFADRVVDAASRSPWKTLLIALAVLVACVSYTWPLELRTDLLELLPRDSPGFKALEHQWGRVGGGSSLTVIVTSPDRAQNEKFIDALTEKIELAVATERSCRAKCAATDASCAAACGGDRIAYVESNSKALRAYFEANKWLYADLKDLEKAEADLDWNIATKSGLVSDLSEPEPAADNVPAAGAGGAVAPAAAERPKDALGLKAAVKKWDDARTRHDSYPTGYFASPDGTVLGMRVMANTKLGGSGGDLVLQEVQKMVSALEPSKFQPQMQIGYTGDIASASDEKSAIMGEAVWATIVVFLVIMGGLVFYYRSVWALPIIIAPALLGVAVAYAFAKHAFGYINISGAFLGAIILGNGINYPIVLLSRYQDFRGRGIAPDVARRAAVANAFRAELVGACVASIAYGSLAITHFRGFSQFGMIGFVGMLLVWLAIVPLVPAMLVLIERLQPHLPAWLRDRPIVILADGSRSRSIRAIAGLTTRHPWWFLAGGAVLFVVSASHIPRYLKDPWEYDFGKLGSKSSDKKGAGLWNQKADLAFGQGYHLAGAVMLADTVEQVPALKKQMLENDANDPQGRLLEDVTTVFDMLPGTPEEQQRKLEVLDDIRSKLTPRVIATLSEEDKKIVERARPPETLRVLGAKDLPEMILRRFTEANGTVGSLMYVKPRFGVSPSHGRTALRLSKTTDNVRLPDGTVVMTASRSTIFAEMINSMRHDGTLISAVAFGAVSLVVLFASRSKRSVFAVLFSLVFGVVMLIGGASYMNAKINYINFIAIPITLGIGCEYPFNIADRTRLLAGDVASAVKRSAGAVLLCSFSTTVGYASLLLSDVQSLQSFGELAVFGEIACVFAAVFFLPSLLTVLGSRKHEA